MGSTTNSHGPGDGADCDAVVIGAGFGGLGAALRLAELGARVVLCETLKYPGGCASTFKHKGYEFEAGATLFSGFGEGQLFRRWIERYGLDVEIDWLDPMVELRTPGLTLPIPAQRQELIRRFCGLPGAPTKALRKFFEYQKNIADVLWRLLDEPDLLPPFGLQALGKHIANVPRYLPLLRIVGKPLVEVLRRFRLENYEPLKTYLNALCQITVQCGVDEAEAPFALSTMDYYFRGTGHVRGGIGQLAHGLVDAIRQRGGEVRLSERVRSIVPENGSFRVETRHGTLRTRQVVANTLPHNLHRLFAQPLDNNPWLGHLEKQVEEGWGACMLYRVARALPNTSGHPHHLEIVQEPQRAFTEGNHLFCSISGADDGGRAPTGYRTLTVSTHLSMTQFRQLSPADQAELVEQIQQHMRQGLETFAPEWCDDITHEMTASPRTFERFTSRFAGYVGGIPRRAGLRQYGDLLPRPVVPNLYLVGDTVFPGQSTLGTAIGGYKLAGHLVKN